MKHSYPLNPADDPVQRSLRQIANYCREGAKDRKALQSGGMFERCSPLDELLLTHPGPAGSVVSTAAHELHALARKHGYVLVEANCARLPYDPELIIWCHYRPLDEYATLSSVLKKLVQIGNLPRGSIVTDLDFMSRVESVFPNGKCLFRTPYGICDIKFNAATPWIQNWPLLKKNDIRVELIDDTAEPLKWYETAKQYRDVLEGRSQESVKDVSERFLKQGLEKLLGMLPLMTDLAREAQETNTRVFSLTPVQIWALYEQAEKKLPSDVSYCVMVPNNMWP